MGGRARDISDQAITASEDQLTDFNLQTQQAQQQVAAQRQAYENIQIKNPYADMENAYEDLTVNQQQADFQAQQGSQQRANIMQGLRGAAGASGIAGLAQSLAGQGQLQTQQISASIGQQEAMNQKMRAQGAMQVQEMEREGEAMVQEAQTARQATLLGMDYGALTGAQAGQQQAFQNQQSAYGMEMDRIQSNKQMWVEGTTGLVTGIVDAVIPG